MTFSLLQLLMVWIGFIETNLLVETEKQRFASIIILNRNICIMENSMFSTANLKLAPMQKIIQQTSFSNRFNKHAYRGKRYNTLATIQTVCTRKNQLDNTKSNNLVTR